MAEDGASGNGPLSLDDPTRPGACKVKAGESKPPAVEEVIDVILHRPLAAALVKVLARTPLSANQVSVLSAIVGATGGLLMLLAIWGSLWWMSVGALFMLLGVVLDCADGQLARLRGTSSMIGRILDGTMDIVTPVFVFHGMAFYLLLAVPTPALESVTYRFLVIWGLGWPVGLSLSWHAAQYDGFKNIFLHCARPDFSLGGATLITLEEIEAMYRDYQARGERFNAFMMSVWIYRTKQYENLTVPWIGERQPRNEAERQVFLRTFQGPMRLFTWLGMGTHSFLLFMGCLLAPLSSWIIWAVWAVITVPLNLLGLYLVRAIPRLMAQYTDELRAMRAEER